MSLPDGTPLPDAPMLNGPALAGWAHSDCYKAVGPDRLHVMKKGVEVNLVGNVDNSGAPFWGPDRQTGGAAGVAPGLAQLQLLLLLLLLSPCCHGLWLTERWLCCSAAWPAERAVSRRRRRLLRCYGRH